MGGRKRRPASWKRVLIDACTQNDFLEPGAIMQVRNRLGLLGNLHKVFAWARSANVPVVSCIESHRPTEAGQGCPLHCIDDTHGQRKPGFSLIEPRILIEADNTLSLPPNLMTSYRQILFRKRARDILGNPKADRFLTSLQAEEFVLFGVGLERTIRNLALGLLARHKNVSVVSDTCGFWSPPDAELVLRQLAAKGIRLLTAEELIAPPPPPTSSAPRRIVYHGRVLRRCHPDRMSSETGSRRRANRS